MCLTNQACKSSGLERSFSGNFAKVSFLSYPFPTFKKAQTSIRHTPGRKLIMTLSPATIENLRMAVDLQPLQMISFGLAVGVLSLFIICTFQKSRHRYPQGPRPFPVLGNVGILKNFHTDPDRQLLQLRDRWGSMCMLWYGSSPVIIMNSPKAARELLNEVCEKDHWWLSQQRIKRFGDDEDNRGRDLTMSYNAARRHILFQA